MKTLVVGAIGAIRSVDIAVQMTIENDIVGTHDHTNNCRVDPKVAKFELKNTIKCSYDNSFVII